MTVKAAGGNQADVEVVLSREQAAELAGAGVELEPKLIDGQTVAEAATLQAEAGFNVFRPYSGDGGLREEYEQIAADNPDITKLVVIGQTVQGQDIIALKVARKASRERDGSKPATLFVSAQHAREWITATRWRCGSAPRRVSKGRSTASTSRTRWRPTAGAQALIIANEDYTGVNPTYPAGTTAPKYTDEYEAALDASGVSHATWDVDAQGVPHHLGVLSHFDAVVWELGDNRLTQDPEDEITDTFLFGPLPDLAVAERQQFLTMAVRDYLNEGGKLVHTGETAQYFGLLGGSIGGIYYGLDRAPTEDCEVTVDFFSDCLLLADDFSQYYLGAFVRTTLAAPVGVAGTATPLDGLTADFGGQAVVDNPLDEAGRSRSPATCCPPTSSRCSPGARTAPTWERGA
jgi:hypothetical protein